MPADASFISFCFFLTSFAQAAQTLCSEPDIVVIDGKVELNDNERILVCGTDRSEGAWRKVPLLQAQYQLNVFLQNRGYLNSTFEIENEVMRVTMGPLTTTEKLELQGTNGVVDVQRKRKIVGEPMIPAKLDEVKTWADLAARRQGHACPEVTMTAQVWDKTIIAQIEPGQLQTIGQITRTGHEDLEPETLLRFEAYRQGQPYNVIKTQITTDRIQSQGLFQNAYITTRCHEDKVDLNFVSEVGKPRMLRFSVGGSTEEFPFSDIWFKNARLDRRASSFLAQLHASDIRQTLELTSEFYVIPGSYRSYLGPRFKIERQKEESYVANKAEIGGDLGRLWDTSNARFRGNIGPTINYASTVTGQGPDRITYLSWDGDLEVMSHNYEAFAATQFEGWNADFEYTGQRKGLGGGLDVDRYDLRFKHLLNVRNLSPPLLVVSTRVEGIMIDTHQRDDATEIIDLPVDLRIYYGGNDNIRGFERHALNNQGRGYLSALLAGFEFRLIEVVPYRIEPFLLFDAAKLGEKQYQLLEPTYISYGGGLRWVSPFGTVRFSAARGEILQENAQTASYTQAWVYFLSFGQEF